MGFPKGQGGATLVKKGGRLQLVKGWGARNPCRKDVTAKDSGPWEVPEGPAGMVPVTWLYLGSRVRVARAVSGSAVAVVEPSAKTLGFRVCSFRC